MEKRISTLALDLGTTTGFALHYGGKIISGTKNFKPSKYEGGGMRYLRFADFLSRYRTVNRVYFETVHRHEGTDAAHVYGGLLATLMAWCEKHHIPYSGIEVSHNKKFWTGKGNANKSAMIAEAESRGFRPRDDNEADAIALLHYALAHGIGSEVSHDQ